MDTVKISFCNSNGYSISNVRSKTKIINQIKERYQLDVFNNNTRIYNDYILDILKKNKYLLCCLITTARPYIMYFTKIYNDNIKKVYNNFDSNVLNVLKVENSVNSKKSFGGTSKQNVIKMINKTLKELR